MCKCSRKGGRVNSEFYNQSMFLLFVYLRGKGRFGVIVFELFVYPGKEISLEQAHILVSGKIFFKNKNRYSSDKI